MFNVNVGEIAKQWYEQNEPEGALAGAIIRCFYHGVIIRRPGFLLMGETIKTDGKQLLAGTPHNAWFIHFWTCEKGSMSSYDLCLEAPFRLEWICYKRRGKMKFIRWDRLYWKDFKVRPREALRT